MRAALPLLIALAGCTPEEVGTVEVGSLTLRLHTPADVDPMAGAETLEAKVRSRTGEVLAEASGSTSEGLQLAELLSFGIVEVQVTSRDANGAVVAGGRSGDVLIEEDVDVEIDMLFLPVNEAIRLDFEPAADRVDHLSMSTPDGKVLLLGGREPSEANVWSDTEWFDPIQGFIGPGPALPGPLYGSSYTWLGEHQMLVSGGQTDPPPTDWPTADSFWIDFRGEELATQVDMDIRRHGHCLAPIHTNAAVAIGGQDESSTVNLEIFRYSVAEGRHDWELILMSGINTADVGACAGAGNGYVATIGRSSDAWGVLDLRAENEEDPSESYRALNGDVSPREATLNIPIDGDIWVLGGWDGFSAHQDGFRVYTEEGAVSDWTGLGERRAWGVWRWWQRDAIVAVAGGYVDLQQIYPVETLELVDPDRGVLLEVDVPVKEPRIEVVQGGAVLFTGGTVGGSPGGAWMVMPWLPEEE